MGNATTARVCTICAHGYLDEVPSSGLAIGGGRILIQFNRGGQIHTRARRSNDNLPITMLIFKVFLVYMVTALSDATITKMCTLSVYGYPGEVPSSGRTTGGERPLTTFYRGGKFHTRARRGRQSFETITLIFKQLLIDIVASLSNAATTNIYKLCALCSIRLAFNDAASAKICALICSRSLCHHKAKLSTDCSM